jgi:hypothetical protein
VGWNDTLSSGGSDDKVERQVKRKRRPKQGQGRRAREVDDSQPSLSYALVSQNDTPSEGDLTSMSQAPVPWA